MKKFCMEVLKSDMNTEEVIFSCNGEEKHFYTRLQSEQIAWEQGYEYGKNEKRPQDNITEEDIQNAIKAGYENGYSMAQAKYQRPQGEWIEDDNHNIVCPFCGGHRRDSRIDHINFCNRCGADMRGKEE